MRCADVSWTMPSKLHKKINLKLKLSNFFSIQSQPCHWRNLKGVTKREIKAEKENSTLSDNVSLFQSIRVLQDEDDEPTVREQTTQRSRDPTETCVKTSVLSALTAMCSMMLCILAGSLFITCTKLKHRKPGGFFVDSSYVTNRSQID